MAASADPPAYVRVERGGLRYEFDAMTGRARVIDLGADPASDLLPAHPERMRDLRRIVEEQTGRTVEDLQEHYREAASALRALGYL